MSRKTVVVLWLVFAFVTWNVVFDWRVSIAAREFTQQQIIRYEHGLPTSRIDTEFEPRVGQAAQTASLYAAGVLACGAITVSLSRQNRPK